MSQHALPDYYRAEAILSLRLAPDEVLIDLRVIRAFLPFVMSQAILVERVSETNPSRHLPRYLLAKIYDPRFYSHRLRPRSPNPWSLEAEIQAASIRYSLGRSWDPNFCRHDSPEDEDRPGWEEWYFQNAEKQYRAEVAAYRQLQSLQGSAIPRHYGVGTLQLPGRAISPHVALLEYLPNAKTLADMNKADIPVPLFNSILNTVDAFGKLGVLHNDLNAGNILFSPSDMPTRAVIIDFGEAGIRDVEDDAQWNEILLHCAEPTWIRKQFKRHGIDLGQ